MSLIITSNYQKGDLEIFEFCQKGESQIIFPLFLKASQRWGEIYKTHKVSILEERNSVSAILTTEIGQRDVGHEFLDFFSKELQFSK